MGRRRQNPEPPEIRPELPRGEIVQTYRQQILERHEAGQKSDFDLREAILRKLELTRQCGQLIDGAKDDLSQKEFSDSVDFLSNEAVAAYLKFARQNPDPITDLRTALQSVAVAMMTTGLLNFPSGRGEQRLHEPNFFSHSITIVQALLADYRKFCQRCRLKDWTVHQLDLFLASLRQVVDVYRDVSLELKSRDGQS